MKICEKENVKEEIFEKETRTTQTQNFECDETNREFALQRNRRIRQRSMFLLKSTVDNAVTD